MRETLWGSPPVERWCPVKRLFLALAALSFTSVPTWADAVSVTLSPHTQTVLVSGSALLTLQFESILQGNTSTYSFQFDVLSGPDAGLTGLAFSDYTFTAFDFDVAHSSAFTFSNSGTAGIDVVEVIATNLNNASVVDSNTVSVDWTTASLPEPRTLILLAMGFGALFTFRTRRFLFTKISNC
jgi:hypothetical protein